MKIEKIKTRACEICGGTHRVRRNRKLGKLLCLKHSAHIYNHGKILDRTVRDGNTFVERDDYMEMICYDRNKKEKGRVKIDKEDREKVEQAGSWCISTEGYPNNARHRTLHIFLLGRKEGLEIDHINRDKLDNRKENLRFVTRVENVRNTKTDNTYLLPSGNWLAYIAVHDKNLALGAYPTKDEAQKVADKAKKLYWKGYTREQIKSAICNSPA